MVNMRPTGLLIQKLIFAYPPYGTLDSKSRLHENNLFTIKGQHSKINKNQQIDDDLNFGIPLS